MSTVKFNNNGIRFDLQIIASWIEPNSTVLDLGCGEGHLLHDLVEHKQVIGTGIEHSEDRVAECISKGLSVIHGDINEEIVDYPDNSFDYVILSQTLQQVYEPVTLLQHLLRIGNKGIVSFPNFSHWRSRLQLLYSGHAPVTKQLPYEWYNTPNIRVITIKDFRKFSKEVGFKIDREAAVDNSSRSRSGKIIEFLPHLRATYGIFIIGKGAH